MGENEKQFVGKKPGKNFEKFKEKERWCLH